MLEKLEDAFYVTVGIVLLCTVLLIDEALGHPITAIPRLAAKYKRAVTAEIHYHWGAFQSAAPFMGQIHQESGFREDAKSAFASGLTQFTPATAEWIQGLYAKDLRELCSTKSGCPMDARWAIRAMAIYDKRLWGQYPFTAGDDRFGFTLAAYNGGAGWISRERREAERRGLNKDKWFGSVELVCIRAEWACRENRHYPRNILFKWRHHYE